MVEVLGGVHDELVDGVGWWFRWCICQCGMTMLVLWMYVILAAMVDDARLA